MPTYLFFCYTGISSLHTYLHTGRKQPAHAGQKPQINKVDKLENEPTLHLISTHTHMLVNSRITPAFYDFPPEEHAESTILLKKVLK